MKRWRDELGEAAQVLTRDELVDTGALGALSDGVAERLGDIIIVCIKPVAIYHIPSASKNSVAMTGQHGSVTLREREVPIIPAGAWR